MSTYIVLKRKSASLSSTMPGAPKFEVLGTTKDGKQEWGLNIERVAPEHAAQLAAAPEVAAVARTMPTTLIKPMDMDTRTPIAASAAAQNAWGIGYVGADQSHWDGSGVKVAVLDTGIDRAHPAFAGMDLVEEDFSGSGNGDRQGHGTHCAGTIFGRDVNGVRIGIARGVQHALIGKVLDDSGSGESAMIFKAMSWALNNNANIISMSLGFDFTGLVDRLVAAKWPPPLAASTALESYRSNLRMFDAIMGILRANKDFGNEPLVVVAAGNESQRDVNPQYRIAASLPAAAVDVVSVAAVDQEGRVANFSNSNAVLCGPGVDILSAWPNNRLNSISGTSMACPHVAGLAALWWQLVTAQQPPANAAKVKNQMLAALKQAGLHPAFNEEDFGQGLVTAP